MNVLAVYSRQRYAAKMTHHAVLHALFVLGFFQKGRTALIQTQQTVVAAVGEDARLHCQLTQSKDVLQVTWKKVLPEGEKTFATYTKHFGEKVNPDFRDKVEFKEAGLQNCSIVIREVKEQDEGCYKCLFNTYPDGALTGRTCLQLYELHEPVLHVRESDSSKESVVSCSATGRPAPTLTLSVTQPDLYFSPYSTVSVNNTSGTVTVTTTAVLSGFHDNSIQVGCAVQVLSGQKEVFMMVPGVKQTSADGFHEESGSDNRNFIGTVIAVVACVCVAAVIAVLKLKHKNSLSHRNHEMSEMPQPTVDNTHMTQATSATQENNQIRQRITPPKNQGSDNPKPSPSTGRRLNFHQC